MPRIPMSDGAGEVVAVGMGVTEFAPGDHVVSTFFPTWLEGEPEISDFHTVPGDGVDGFAREQVTMPASAFTRAPKDYSHAEAATLTCAGLTAWRALMVDGDLKPGGNRACAGNRGVSVFALQFAKAAGATVIATSSSNEKLDRLKALGADYLINYREDEDWGNSARHLTGGRGVDHVIEVGGPASLAQWRRPASAVTSPSSAFFWHDGNPAVAHGSYAAAAPQGPGGRPSPVADGHDPGHRRHRLTAGNRSPFFAGADSRGVSLSGKQAPLWQDMSDI